MEANDSIYEALFPSQSSNARTEYIRICARTSTSTLTAVNSAPLQAQELIDKCPNMPNDVVWHFIGHLQSNKAKALVTGVPNLSVLETLDTSKLASKLQVMVTDRLGNQTMRHDKKR